jgi:hypothetical protein
MNAAGTRIKICGPIDNSEYVLICEQAGCLQIFGDELADAHVECPHCGWNESAADVKDEYERRMSK